MICYFPNIFHFLSCTVFHPAATIMLSLILPFLNHCSFAAEHTETGAECTAQLDTTDK